MSEQRERDFKGVWIPAHIYLDEALSPIEKILLAEIDSLDKTKEKGCFASNAYLGEFIQKAEGTTANIIASLKKRGYIEQCFFDGRMRGLRTCYSRFNGNGKPALTKPSKQVSRNRESGIHDSVNILIQSTNTKEDSSLPDGKEHTSNKFDEGDFEQIEDVLEVAQPTNQNEKEKKEKSCAKKERKDYDKEARLEDAKEVLALLSERSGRAYAAYRGAKPTNALEMASKAILSAYKDFVLPLYEDALKNGSMNLTDAKAMAKDSVLALVAFKSDEWKGTSTAEFLRPETLFGSRNFLKYMEQMQACNGEAPKRQPTNLSSHEQKLNEMRANNIRANMPDAKEDYIF